MPSTALPDRFVPSLLREARRQLMNHGDISLEMIDPALARSWQRSWAAGLQPCGRMVGAPNASGAQLARELERQRELVAHARPVMEFLHEQTCGTDSMSILAGADGMLLHTLGDPQFISRAERVALRSGATWHEQFRGTNAIGTALADDRAVVIHADEHYLERNSFLTCAAVPIHDPRGCVQGVLDVSGDRRGYHRHTLGLVRSAARMIEHRLFDTRHDPRLWQGVRLRFHQQPEGIGTVAESLLALTSDGELVGANAAALELLGLGWSSLGHTGLDAVLHESLGQLLDWGHRGGGTRHIVHTRTGRAVWVQVESGRVTSGLRADAGHHPARSSVASNASDALQALDTGDATYHGAITRARKVMNKPIALMLQGESGVGKEVFARAVHGSGQRQGNAFVAVNCAALPEHLIEAELFGYRGGAFTGARREGAPGRIREAHGGTLLLDEIGDMPLPLQARLLRVLQEREVVPLGGGQAVSVDFALICATHRDLSEEMQAGRLRQDLYYRLNGLCLHLPSLRERSDLGDLIRRELRAVMPHQTVALAPDIEEAFARYDWPGNLRQLANALRTACAMLDEGEAVINWEHLPDDLALGLRQLDAPDSADHSADLTQHPDDALQDLRSVSRQTIDRVVADCQGNLSEAARRLGISRNTLYRRKAH